MITPVFAAVTGGPVRVDHGGWVVVVGGCVGTALVAVASWRVGAVPVAHGPTLPVPPGVGDALYGLGLALVLGAWLALGLRRASVRRVRAAAFAWGAPLLAALPVESRDAWAYLAQGRLAGAGVDPYRHGPAALSRGAAPLAAQVSPRWLHAASPYGPVWLRAAQLPASLADRHLVAAVLLVRVPALAGLVLLAWAVPVLARRAGLDPAPAAWLAVANPAVLVVVLGGAHNDLLMVGLLLAGLAAATEPRLRRAALPLAAGLVVSAALVKAPAALALLFLVPLRSTRDGLRRELRGYAVVIVSAAASFAALTAACGLGVGWLHHLGRNPADPYGWVSLVDLVVLVVRPLTGAGFAPVQTGSGVTHAVDLAAGVLTAALVVVCWSRARSGRPLLWLGVALLVAVLLAATIRQWYACWPLAVLAAGCVPSRRGIAAFAAVSVVLTAGSSAAGHSVLVTPWLAAVLAAAALAAVAARALPRAGADRTVQESRASSATG